MTLFKKVTKGNNLISKSRAFHNVGAAYTKDLPKNELAHVLLIGRTHNKQGSKDARVRIVVLFLIIKDVDDIKNIETPVAVFIDISKEFDTMEFDILLYKLHYYGIRGTSLTLIQNYLSNRTHYTHYENQDSDLLDLKIGIPQGSTLGPLFFSIYINDLVNASKKLSCLMYADDTTIHFNQEDFPKINRSTSINVELEKLSTWLIKLNKLTLNVEKN